MLYKKPVLSGNKVFVANDRIIYFIIYLIF